MKEDRSWIAPLAFVTFGGIIVVAVIAFLKLEGLLLTERGSALVAWLTLVVTGCAFGAALTALFVALKQMKFSQTQAEIAVRDEIEGEQAYLDHIEELHTRTQNKILYVCTLTNPEKLQENDKREIINRLLETIIEFLEVIKRDKSRIIFQPNEVITINNVFTDVKNYIFRLGTGNIDQPRFKRLIERYTEAMRPVRANILKRRVLLKHIRPDIGIYKNRSSTHL